jgi:ankyrin repeat protein/L-ascorbate metabolism protein UlaG (beta-lactamase superfamily)
MARITQIHVVAFLIPVLAAAAWAGEIHDAAAGGDLEAVAGIVADNPELVNSKGEDGIPPLHLAAAGGHLDVIKLLVDKGACVHLGDRENSTALDVAAQRGFEEIVAFLIDKGTDITRADANGMTCLHFAVFGGHEDIARMLIDKGADLEARTINGETPLLMGARSRLATESILELLLDHGADANAQAQGGATPLIQAAATQRIDCVKLFLSKGADPNKPNDHGLTPLTLAALRGSLSISELLLESGAKLDILDKNGQTPLITAITSGNAEFVELFAEQGADLDAAEKCWGRTALHFAAARGDDDAVGILLKCGANADVEDDSGMTPLHLAAKYGHRNLAGALEARCKPVKNIEENYGKSPCLNKTLADKEAVLWYLGHCGWAIKTRNHFLILDYWNEGVDPLEPSLANGHIDPSEIADQNVTVFVTHGHGDHFSREIFAWEYDIEDIEYVYGFRPEDEQPNSYSRYRGPEYTYIGPRQTKSMDGMTVKTIKANDAGVGFLIEVDGLSIYHAGDHAGWAVGQKKGFTDEIDYLAGQVKNVDFAFVNVTGCHAHGEEPLKEGTLYTIAKLNPRVLIPTHAHNREFIYRKSVTMAKEMNLGLDFYCPECRGDRFEYSRISAD